MAATMVVQHFIIFFLFIYEVGKQSIAGKRDILNHPQSRDWDSWWICANTVLPYGATNKRLAAGIKIEIRQNVSMSIEHTIVILRFYSHTHAHAADAKWAYQELHRKHDGKRANKRNKNCPILQLAYNAFDRSVGKAPCILILILQRSRCAFSIQWIRCTFRHRQCPF